jgi:hypothetical protein
LADRDALGIWADRDDLTDDFMPKDGWVLGQAPFIVQDGKVGVTQTTMLDFNLNLLLSECSEINNLQFHRLFGRTGDPCFRGVHSFLRLRSPDLV